MDLCGLRARFRDAAQVKRAQNVIADRLADDRSADECRFLLRFAWQLAVTYREVTMDELRDHVSPGKLQLITDLIRAAGTSPAEIDQWITTAEEGHPVVHDRGFRQLYGAPLEDGMNIAVRTRHDFTITDSARLLEHARRAYLTSNPESTAEDAARYVVSAEDAIFAILELGGIAGPGVSSPLDAHQDHGLRKEGWRVQVTVGDPRPLRPGPDCLRDDDPFALPG
jgi:hypothetical protein